MLKLKELRVGTQNLWWFGSYPQKDTPDKELGRLKEVLIVESFVYKKLIFGGDA